MRPIDLALLAGKGAQTQIGLRLAARAMAGDHVAEVIGATAVTTLAHHAVEPAGGQGWELLERGENEGEVGIDTGASGTANARQADLRQHPGDGALMHVQLPRDGAGAPS